MRLVYSVNEAFNLVACIYCGHNVGGRGYCCKCLRWSDIGDVRSGPRQRLPQAKDVPEGVILAIMRAHPLKTFTHWNVDGDNSLPRLSPELAAFPEKVLHAKLKSMARRGLIRGWGDSRMRGDWSVHLGRYYGR